MAIVISSNIELINPENPDLWSHEDIYGKGGYVVINRAEPGKTTINSWIGSARRKQGMVVYDIDTGEHYRCITVEQGPTPDDNWELTNFGGGTDGGGIIDINPLGLNGISSNWNSSTQTLQIEFTGGINNLSDIVTTDLQEGDSLVYDGTNWITASPIGSVTTTTPDAIDISWNPSARELLVNFTGSLDDLSNVDTKGKAPNDFLMWDGSDWIATTLPDFSSTDGGGAPINSKFLTWGNDLTLENEKVLTAGDGIFFDINTDNTAILSVNLQYIADLFPQYTDGELDVARESSLQAVLALLLASIGTDGFEGFSPTSITSADTNNIVVTENSTFSYTLNIGTSVVTLDAEQALTNKTYNGFNFTIDNNISSDLIEGLYGRIVLEGGDTEKNAQSLIRIINGSRFEIELDLTIPDGSILMYDATAGNNKWINTNEISGGNAFSFA